MEENFSMEWNMEWKIFGMEWKKIASMDNGKISFHSIPCSVGGWQWHNVQVAVLTVRLLYFRLYQVYDYSISPDNFKSKKLKQNWEIFIPRFFFYYEVTLCAQIG